MTSLFVSLDIFPVDNFQYYSTRQQFPVKRLWVNLKEYASLVMRNVNKNFQNTFKFEMDVALTLKR